MDKHSQGDELMTMLESTTLRMFRNKLFKIEPRIFNDRHIFRIFELTRGIFDLQVYDTQKNWKFKDDLPGRDTNHAFEFFKRTYDVPDIFDDSDDGLCVCHYTQDKDLNKTEIVEILKIYQTAREVNENEDISDLENFKL